jgi:hypothetical protein
VRNLFHLTVAVLLMSVAAASAQEKSPPHYAVKTCDRGDCNLSGEYYGRWACQQAAARQLKADNAHGRNPTFECVMAQ